MIFRNDYEGNSSCAVTVRLHTGIGQTNMLSEGSWRCSTQPCPCTSCLYKRQYKSSQAGTVAAVHWELQVLCQNGRIIPNSNLQVTQLLCEPAAFQQTGRMTGGRRVRNEAGIPSCCINQQLCEWLHTSASFSHRWLSLCYRPEVTIHVFLWLVIFVWLLSSLSLRQWNDYWLDLLRVLVGVSERSPTTGTLPVSY